MHLKQPGFTDSACGPLTKNKERIESFMQTGRPQTLFIEMNLIEPVFNMIWLIVNQNIQQKRTESDKVLRDKAFKIASDTKYDGYQRELASMVYKFFDRKSCGSGVATEPNYQLANKLHRQIIRTFKRRSLLIFQRQYLGC